MKKASITMDGQTYWFVDEHNDGRYVGLNQEPVAGEEEAVRTALKRAADRLIPMGLGSDFIQSGVEAGYWTASFYDSL